MGINSYVGRNSLTLALLSSCNSSETVHRAESGLSTVVQDSVRNVQDSICKSIDLRQKVGFTADFFSNGEKLCYGVELNDTDYYEFLHPCDKGEGKMGFSHYFAGPNKGDMSMIYFLSSGGQTYLPFWRDASGNISGMIFTPIPDHAKEMFDFGASELDKAKRNLPVCMDLIKYNSK